MSGPRWEPGVRATRAQVKEEWKLYLVEQLELVDAYSDEPRYRTAMIQAKADEIAESIVNVFQQGVEAATGKKLPQ